MKVLISSLVFLMLFTATFAQSLVSKKIAQRHDEFINNNWVGQDSLVFNYSSNGKEVFREALEADGNNGWMYNYKTMQLYDNNENLIERRTERFSGGNWNNVSLYTNSYDGNNNLTETLYQTWVAGTNVWQNAGRNIFTYNSLGNELTYNSYIWQNNAWDNYTKRNSSYYGDSLLKESQTFIWIFNDWKREVKTNYTYIQNYITSIERAIDGTTGWVPNTRTDYLVNISFNPARVEEQSNFSFDTLFNIWNINSKIEYNFTNNLLDQELFSNYNNATSTWTNSKRIEYVYNSIPLRTSMTEETFDVGSSQWGNSIKEEYAYNAQDLLEQKNEFTWLNSAWQNVEETNYTYNSDDSLTYRLREKYNNNNFVPYLQDFFYYQLISVGTQDISANRSFSIYPNPVANQLLISDLDLDASALQILSIYSIEGKIVWSQQSRGPKTTQLDVSFLNKGQYILQISDGKRKVAQQFTKF